VAKELAMTAQGLIQIYTGEGKGKTTAALGLAMRASGQGLRVGFIQFLKNEPTGEHFFVERYHPFEIIQISTVSSFSKDKSQQLKEARKTLERVEKDMLSQKYDLIILDEVFIAVDKGLISVEELANLLKKKPSSLEMVLTGRYAPPEIIQMADLVTEMHLVKHPYQSGVPARRGIEY
jgi:cob(I)alamin adenosyltransferase